MTTHPVKITKVEDEAPSMSGVTTEIPSTAGKRKSLKTYPRGILKTAKNKAIMLKPVSDPAKSPPIKKSMKKHTIRILTDKGIRHHRKTIKHKMLLDRNYQTYVYSKVCNHKCYECFKRSHCF